MTPPPYLEHFGLKRPPFSIAPDPSFLYMGPRHQEAFAHLLYGFQNDGGFVLLTGEVGTGKTTVSRALLEQVAADTQVAYIVNPRLSATELLAAVCDELEVAVPGGATVKELVDRLNRHLLANHGAGRRTVLVIDEAQNLADDVLEQVRLLTNLETATTKLLQIILIGQPELRNRLAAPHLRQLAQRITARYHLEPLGRDEVAAYLAHRLRQAGGDPRLLAPGCVRRLHRASGGVPRLINVITDRALMGAYAQGRQRVTPRILARAAREVLGEERPSPLSWRLLAAGLATALALVLWPLAVEEEGAPPAEGPPPVAAGPVSPSAADDGGGQGEKVVTAMDLPAAEATPVETAEEEETPAVQTFHWQLVAGEGGSRRHAFAQLFQLLGLAYDPTAELGPCTYAETQGWRCYYTITRLADLERLNRPAVLQLRGEGREAFVVLTALDGGTATLRSGGASFRLARRTLELLWTGHATVAWRPPAGFAVFGKAKGEAAARTWLAGMGVEVGQGSLTAAVKRFQVDHGLIGDGRLGSRTVMVVQNCAGKGGPLLTGQPGCAPAGHRPTTGEP